MGERKAAQRLPVDSTWSPQCTHRPQSGFSPAPTPKWRRRTSSGVDKGVSNDTVAANSDRRRLRVSLSPDLPDDAGDSVHTAEQKVELKQLKEKLQAMMRGRGPAATVRATKPETERSSTPDMSGVQGSDDAASQQQQSMKPSAVDEIEGDEVAIVRVHQASHGNSQDHQAVPVPAESDVSNEAFEEKPGTAARERLFVCLEFCQCVCFVESKGGCSRTRQPYLNAVLYRLQM